MSKKNIQQNSIKQISFSNTTTLNPWLKYAYGINSTTYKISAGVGLFPSA